MKKHQIFRFLKSDKISMGRLKSLNFKFESSKKAWLKRQMRWKNLSLNSRERKRQTKEKNVSSRRK
jgi:hypothetical protein